jgi:hypothetical protein
MKNPCGKLRPIEDPYAVYWSADGWEWRVLKKNLSPDQEARNPFAAWFCATKSPFTFGRYEYGDVYAADVLKNGVDVTEETMVADRIAGG